MDVPAGHRRVALRYLAAVTMISTSSSRARAGGFSGSTQAFHTEFISANRTMSSIQRLAESRFNLLVPAWARSTCRPWSGGAA